MSGPSPPTAPAASVVIRALDEAASLESVLSAVLRQEGVGPLEVIVIDSGSRDGTLDIVRRFPVRLHQLDPGVFTFGGALNLGARLASGPVCVHLSAHCSPTHPRWLARLLAPLAEPEVIAAYGRQIPIPGVNPYEELDLERIFPAHPLPPGARPYFSNANCAVRRGALLARPFDETIAIMEDTLWLLDLPPGQRVVYVPEAPVWHSHPLRARYWYARYRRDGMAYRYIKSRRNVDLLPARALRVGNRALGLAAEFALLVRTLIARRYWRHLAAYPLFCVMREVGLRRGLRAGARLYPWVAPPREAAPRARAWTLPPPPRPATAPRPGPASVATPRVAAVVLNYRTPEETALAVRSLQASERSIQDVIVVDNGSADGSEAFLRTGLPEVTVLQSEANLGFAGGTNIGIRSALHRGAELVLLVNSDARLEPDCLTRLEEALGREPGVGVVGPVVLSRSAPERIASAGMRFSPVTGRMRHHRYGERFQRGAPSRVVDAASGCVMLIRRAVFERIGLFAEEYFFSFEDLDFCLRARRAGFAALCVGGAVAEHAGSRSIGPHSPRRLYFATRNHLLVASRATPRVGAVRAGARAASILLLNLAHAVVSADVPVWQGLGSVLRGAWHYWRRRYGDGP